MTIERAEVREDGLYLKFKNGPLARMLAHDDYLADGFVTFDVAEGNAEGMEVMASRDAPLEGLTQSAAHSPATRDPLAVDLTKQHKAIMESGHRPKIGKIDLDNPIIAAA